MEKLRAILEDIDDGIDFENEAHLIDDHILDSFAIITLVSEIEDGFGIEIDAASLVPENFNSVEAMYQMIQKKQQER